MDKPDKSKILDYQAAKAKSASEHAKYLVPNGTKLFDFDAQAVYLLEGKTEDDLFGKDNWTSSDGVAVRARVITEDTKRLIVFRTSPELHI